MVVFLLFIFGLAIGWFLCKRTTFKKSCVGTLRVDQSDKEDGPYIFLELEHKNALDKIISSKNVSLKVLVEDYVTQK